MNDTRTLVPVEEEILRELRAHVAQRTTAVRRRRRVVQGVGVAAAAALVVGGSFLLPRGTSPLAPAPATAADVLQSAAHAAAGAPATTGTYWRVETTSKSGDTTITWQSKDGRTWTSQDGKAPIEGRSPSGFYLCENQVGYEQLTALPTDPAALRQSLTEAMATDPDAEADPSAGVATCLTGLLFDVPVPPGVRAAAWQALADGHGIRNLGTTTDRHGRHGTALRFSEFGTVSDLVVDQDAGALLQYDQAAPAGSKASDETITAGWTDAPPSS